jgi:UDP:flavonoid glycosyltransferase YjiC (YdhE family)
LGLNLTHLSRLVPLAQQLRQDGHAVLVAVREIPAAAAVLGSAGIAFVQAPHLLKGLPPPGQISGYADILLSQGWDDPEVLWGLTQSWLTLVRLFEPDVVVLDHSPTALLATAIGEIPAILIGNGFELPPASDPLPAFPDCAGGSAGRAALSERQAMQHASAVARRFGRAPIPAFRVLLDRAATLFVTLPDLDPYANRAGARYVGPLMGFPSTRPVEWPEGRQRVFAFLRRDTPHIQSILASLRDSDASVLCLASGVAGPELKPHARSGIRFVSHWMDLKPVLAEADLCISCGAEEVVVMTAMLGGVPQLISPGHVEAELMARRIECLGAGLALRGPQTAGQVTQSIGRLIEEPIFRNQARAFAKRYSEMASDRSALEVAALVLDESSSSQQAGSS